GQHRPLRSNLCTLSARSSARCPPLGRLSQRLSSASKDTKEPLFGQSYRSALLTRAVKWCDLKLPAECPLITQLNIHPSLCIFVLRAISASVGVSSVKSPPVFTGPAGT